MKLFALFLVVIFIYGCEKEDDLPNIHIAPINYEDLTNNEYDKNRLCMGEVISKLLLEEKFREFVKSKTVNEFNSWNKEILLIKYWDEELYDGLTLSELLTEIIDNNSGICVESIEKFEAMLFEDPVLVLKIPDIIDAKKWDTKNTVPFLYIKTNDLVKNGLTTDSASIVGIHGSGIIDRYYWNVPKYYPVVLKNSEDYFLVDRHLNLSNGVNLNLYHDYNPNILSLEILLNEPLYINNEERFLVEINSLLKTINEQNGKIKNPYDLNSCSEDCVYACIPENERKLTADKVFIQSQNPSALAYEYTSVYRFNSHFILEDNLVFLALTNHRSSGVNNWKRNILGSFRVNDLFDIQFSNSVNYVKYKVNSKSYSFPEINIVYDVLGGKTINVDNILLASDIIPDDLLVFSSARIKLDMMLGETIGIDGKNILATGFHRDNVLNYSLYCIPEEKILGFNSLSIECDF